jgi:exopolysaccharide biosynthesis polyprenyl glycosylphosphotransferase
VTSAGTADPTALGVVDRLPEILEEQNIQEVIVSAILPRDVMRRVATACFEGGCALFVSPPLPGAPEYRAEPLRVGGCALLRLHPARLEFPALLMKRCFDLVIAAVVLLLCAPVMLLVAAAIRLDSPGPVFYRAKRVGLGGSSFLMWKFRSMYADADQRERELEHLNIYRNGTFKIANDPRVTRVGKLLRRTSLDELPQLFNVLSGDMSLVGPRPALPADLGRYQPHHFERLTVIPGITGPWQVGGRNLITDFEAIIGMERQYIERWSLLLDIKILLRTPAVVWKGEGAY